MLNKIKNYIESENVQKAINNAIWFCLGAIALELMFLTTHAMQATTVVNIVLTK